MGPEKKMRTREGGGKGNLLIGASMKGCQILSGIFLGEREEETRRRGEYPISL